jgi:hypothetical protein
METASTFTTTRRTGLPRSHRVEKSRNCITAERRGKAIYQWIV